MTERAAHRLPGFSSYYYNLLDVLRAVGESGFHNPLWGVGSFGADDLTVALAWDSVRVLRARRSGPNAGSVVCPEIPMLDFFFSVSFQASNLACAEAPPLPRYLLIRHLIPVT